MRSARKCFRQLQVSLFSAAMLTFASNLWAEVTNAVPAGGTTNFYTGSGSCRECHGRFYQLWASSHHGMAMQPFATARTNLTAPVAPIAIGGTQYLADLRQGVVIAHGADGEKRYGMEEAMGGKNIFYFLTPLERGRLQVLPVAYDVRRKEWFDTAASAMRHFATQPDEALDWREAPYTFNASCFNCHVSQLTNNYDPATDTYHTSWGEPGINCENCHGPAAEHIGIARATPEGEPLKALGLINFKSFSNDQVNSACAACHARIYPITLSFTPGDRFFDHFGLGTLEQADFYPDGRDLGETFTYTTWRLSPCIKSGELDCVACHTSSGRYRFAGAQVNDACLPCHADKVKNAVVHSHHAAGTEGMTCVACHLPTTEFGRMRRTDHSMRPPMPALTLACGSPNACNLCHTNRNAAWADQQVRAWAKQDYQAPVLERAAWIAAARKGDWSKLPAMVKYLASPAREEVWAASLIHLLRGCDAQAKWAGIMPCLKDPSPLVRAAAVEDLGDNLNPDTLGPLVAATHDDCRLVRVRAAGVLAGIPPDRVPEADRQALLSATDELVASLRAHPDDASSYDNLGSFYLERRELSKAIEAFTSASRRQPNDVSALVNISLAYNMAGQNESAERSLRRALRLEPTNAVINLNLGMLLAEMGKLDEAEKAFRTAVKSDPKSASAAFNLGVLLAKDRPEEALTWCRRAAQLRPDEPKYPYTLAFFQHQQGQNTEAIETLRKLLEQNPSGADSYALLAQIYEESKLFADALSVCRRAAANPKLTEEERARFQAQVETLSSKAHEQ